MKYFSYFALIPIIFSLSSISMAKVYKWTDENGQLHYSDKPPKDITSEEVQNLPTKKHSPSEQSQTDLDHYREQMKTDTTQTEAAKEKEAQRKHTQELDAQECEKAKARHEKLITFNRIRMEDKNGELHYLTPEQKEEEIQKSNTTIKEFCH